VVPKVKKVKPATKRESTAETHQAASTDGTAQDYQEGAGVHRFVEVTKGLA
jgi:hypothetical protein